MQVANWGSDAAEFRPERWFEKDADYLFGASDQRQKPGERGWPATGGAASPGTASNAFEMGVVRSVCQVALSLLCLPTARIVRLSCMSLLFLLSHTELAQSRCAACLLRKHLPGDRVC